jgi:oxepin-CoA hydrolase/3-oxo-5,6-dehydrosuberyl-CoA semialdehyde dehydrogenase
MNLILQRQQLFQIYSKKIKLNSARLIQSLKNLQPGQVPLWGKMTLQHMVEHLYSTVQASINEIDVKIYTEERKIPVVKRLFFGDRDLPKEFMNPAIGPDLLQLQFDSLESAIIELSNVLIRYNKFFEDNPTAKTIHPVFGYLTKEEWDIFHQKHFKHHLSQFGISD